MESTESIGKNGHAVKSDEESKQKPTRGLSNTRRLAYGVGHVLNDLTASMWFSYLLVFLHQVRNFPNLLAGNLVVIGQVSDAVFTPFIGFESDRTKGFKKIGKRKSWHLVGTFCVMVSFPFLFMECITCGHAPNWAQFIYYAPFVVIFQFGWAATQISHLSLSSELSSFSQERVALQSIRNFFTVFANLSVYGIFFLLFTINSGRDDSSDLGPGDADTFRNLTFICIGIGVAFNLMFFFGTKEKSEEEKAEAKQQKFQSTLETSTVRKSQMKWIDWLKEYQFYQVAVVYMCTRLYINVSQVYLPMYLTETINLDKKSIALLPFISYGSSFIMSLLASFINNSMGRKFSYLLGLSIGVSTCIWMYMVPRSSNQIYGSAVFLGASGSLLLITSLSMTNDLIDENTESGAFVFGAMSFTDKLSNGVAVFLIQYFHPCEGCCPACEPYYRHVQSFVPGAALCVAFVVFLTLLPQTLGHRRVNLPKFKPLDQVNDIIPENNSQDSQQCSCGRFYIPPNVCGSCGIIQQAHEYGRGGDECCSVANGSSPSATSFTEDEPLMKNKGVGNINSPYRYLADTTKG